MARRPSAAELTLKSPAKINLGLHVLDLRPDGYHNIETTFKVISLHDTLTFSASDALQISCDRDDVPVDEENLCTRAVRTLVERTRSALPVRIRIVKRIPMGAGLGGGSSNAACTLVVMNRMFELGLEDEELMELGAKVGSDVPFFVGYLSGKGSTAMGRGKGEVLDFFEWPLAEKVLVVFPGIHISTAWAYANFSNYLRAESEPGKSSLTLTNSQKSTMFSALFDKPLFFDNYFEPLVLANHEKIRVLRDLLESERPVLCRMSGSGSTIFALFEPDRDLTALTSRLTDHQYWVCEFA